ncbi:MAG: methyltransferase domain-containing protein [Nitrospinota bacterium]|nr:methyltransferase domain-containing protein [Nitrospinota bacterium]
MSSWYGKYYWRAGFKTRLYDWLTPESYYESMRQTIKQVSGKAGQKIWDVGCGSGLLLRFFKESLNGGMIYYGSDLLFAGLEQVKIRAKELKVSSEVNCFQNDVTEASPFKENSMDVVVAHFSIYTISEIEKRHQAIKNMFLTLKPNGILIVVCPSKDYDAGTIIKESFELVKVRKGYFAAMIKRIFFYPLTKYLGLNFIQKQLKLGNWMAYSIEDLSGELNQAGFKIFFIKTVYARGAYLMCGIKEY